MIARATGPTRRTAGSADKPRFVDESAPVIRTGTTWIQKHTVAYVAVGFLLGVTLGCFIKRK